MGKDSLFGHLLKGDAKKCFPFLENASSGGKDLICFLDEILFTAASIKYEKVNGIHPIMTINSIKNIIGDNKTKPSQPLLKYCIDLCSKHKIIDYNQKIDKQYSEITVPAVFVGTFEDAIQSGSWDEVEKMMSKIYYASDRSQSIIEIIADLGFQNIDMNGLMIFHLLRAFNFKQNKSHVWTYASCLINFLKKEPLPRPSKRKNINPLSLIKQISKQDNIEDIIKYSAVLRIWEGDYIRISSYQREISSWLHKRFSDRTEIDKKNDQLLSEDVLKHHDFVKVAESIILKNSSTEQKSKDIIALDALRYLKNKNGYGAIYFHMKYLL